MDSSILWKENKDKNRHQITLEKFLCLLTSRLWLLHSRSVIRICVHSNENIGKDYDVWRSYTHFLYDPKLYIALRKEETDIRDIYWEWIGNRSSIFKANSHTEMMCPVLKLYNNLGKLECFHRLLSVQLLEAIVEWWFHSSKGPLKLQDIWNKATMIRMNELVHNNQWKYVFILALVMLPAKNIWVFYIIYRYYGGNVVASGNFDVLVSNILLFWGVGFL